MNNIMHMFIAICICTYYAMNNNYKFNYEMCVWLAMIKPSSVLKLEIAVFIFIRICPLVC